MIETEGLTKQLGGRTVVSDVTFRCEPGTVTGFLGPNGAGKSTTMRMLVGLSEPDSGEARILGGRYRDLPNPGRRVGILLDASAQHAGRRGREALAVSARTMGVPVQRVDDAAGARRPRRGGRPAAGRPVLARHAPAPRLRPRAARRPRGPDPRRARQRPRSRGHALDARAAAGLRRPRRHRAALLAPAGRGRGRRRPDDDHRRRTDPGAGHPRRAADRVRDHRRGGRPRRRSTPRSTAPAWRCTPPTAIGGWSRPSPRSSPALAMAERRRAAPASPPPRTPASSASSSS